jgi:riboflavin kinase / FMN adenylyltransferase
MQIYNGFDNINIAKGTVVTVGTFDGVHLGHQTIIDTLLAAANQYNLIPVILTIDPHPQIVLNKAGKPPLHLLTSINERLKLFERFGVENALIIPFSKEFAKTTPEYFIKEYLVKRLNVKHILLGYDHLFGRNREGNFDLLTELSNEFGFMLSKVDPLLVRSEAISSTLIRKYIASAEIEQANKMLGYDYLLEGVVVHGQGRARSLGWPTANLERPDIHKLLPANGVYSVSSLFDGKRVFGMANIGFRPTLTDDNVPTLEVNYFDIDKDMYGDTLTVEFHKYLRQEIKFSNLDDLIARIAEDEVICRNIAEELK